jgi:SAM-dependent methyltransferase
MSRGSAATEGRAIRATERSGPNDRELRRRSFREGGASPLDDLIFRLRARRILGHAPATSEVVADLGAGHDYRLLRHLVKSGRTRRGIAVDLSLKQPGPAEIRVIEADLGQPLPIDNASVDAVLSLAVVEHLDSPRVHLAEACRILRPGGVLLLTSPSRRSQPLLEFMAYRLHVIDEHEIRDHRHYYNEAELRELLIGAGFAPGSITYRTFLLGLNQFVVARRPATLG